MSAQPGPGWSYLGHHDQSGWIERYFVAVKGRSRIGVGDEVRATRDVNLRTGPIELVGNEWVNKPRIRVLSEGEVCVVSDIREVFPGYYWLRLFGPPRRALGWTYLGEFTGGNWVSRHFDPIKSSAHLNVGDEVSAKGSVNVRQGPIEFNGSEWVNKPVVGSVTAGERFFVEEIRQPRAGFYWLRISRAETSAAVPAGSSGLWIEADGAAFKRRDILVNGAEVQQSEFLIAAGDLAVRSAMSRSNPVVHTLKPGDAFEVVIVERQRSAADGGPIWLQIQAASSTVARAPVATGRAAGEKSNGIWWEYPVAEATGGYDAKQNRTLVNSFHIAVFGPSSVDDTVRSICEDCVKAAATAAYSAFQATPSPEIGARFGAACKAFRVSLQACFKLKALADVLASKFDIGYVRRGRWVDGLNIRLVAGTPTAENYRKIHNLIKDKLPDPLNKLITLYIATQELPPVDVVLAPPRILRDVLAQLPDPKELREFSAAAEQLALKDGKRILAEVQEEAKRTAVRLGEEALNEVRQVTIRLAGEAAEAAVREGPEILKTIVPIMAGGEIVFRPVIKIAEDLNWPPLPALPPLPKLPSLPTIDLTIKW